MRTTSITELRERIVEHPWPAIAAALALGAWAAVEQPRVPKNRLARHALAVVGAIALRAAREAAMSKVIRPWVAEVSRAYTPHVA